MSRVLQTTDTLASSAAELGDLLRSLRNDIRIEVGRWEAPPRVDAAHAITFAHEAAAELGVLVHVPLSVVNGESALMRACDALAFLDDDAISDAVPYDDARDAVAIFEAWFAGALYCFWHDRTTAEVQTLVVAVDARSTGALLICTPAH